MNKKVMRPLTEAEMQTVNGGGLFGLLFGKILGTVLKWILPDGKCKEAAIDAAEVVTTVVI